MLATSGAIGAMSQASVCRDIQRSTSNATDFVLECIIVVVVLTTCHE